MRKSRAVIVGAGPAGLGAAVELARRGLAPLVLDEHPAPGGQIYTPPPAAVDASALSLQLTSSRLGQTLLEEVQTLQGAIQLLPSTCVTGLFDPLEITYTAGGPLQRLQATTLLLATGAYDRVIPFPGWTMPGVITVGGLQTLLKYHGIMPGKRIVVAGAGLLLWLVAAQLTMAGSPPVAIVEANGGRDLLAALPGLLLQPSLLWEGLYLRRLVRQSGVRVLPRRAVVRACGAPTVAAVEIAAIDAHWRPERSRTETIPTDCLAVSFGLVPEVALPRLAGATCHYHAALGGWVPAYNHDMETTRKGVFVAGDGCGIRGAEIAQLQGRLAGLAMAARLGAWQDSRDRNAKTRLQETLAHHLQVRHRLQQVYRIRPGIYDLIDDDTLLCRCEEITWGEVRAWLDRGINSPTQLKMTTRIGMGRCQGRFCAPNLRHVLQRALGEQAEVDEDLTIRPPVKPMPLANLANMAED